MKRWLCGAIALALALTVTVSAAGTGLAQGSQALVRVVNAVADSPPVDVMLDNSRLFSSLTSKAATHYAFVNAGTYSLSAVATSGPFVAATPAATSAAAGITVSPSSIATPVVGTTVSPTATPATGQSLVQTTVTLNANTPYSIVLTGQPGSVQAVVLADELAAPPQGKARVRFMHAVPGGPSVDLSVRDLQGGEQARFNNVSFRQVTSYAAVSASGFEVQVRDAQTDNVIVTVPNIRLNDGVVYTVYTVGLVAGPPPVQAILVVESVSGMPVPTG